MTDMTLRIVEWARAAQRDDLGSRYYYYATTSELVDAIVELAGARPHPRDKERAENGEYVRCSGDVECKKCGHVLYDHPVVPGQEFLRRRCDGEFVKL